MTKKFSDLTSIDNLLAEDILAVVDTSETASRYITLANLTESVIGSAGAGSIINVLNDHEGGTVYGNGLYAGWLWHEGAIGTDGNNVPAYKDGNYYLEYSNFTNTPILKTDLRQFENTARFLRLTGPANAGTASKINTSTGADLGGALQELITTDNLDEGDTNEYYTNEKDQLHLVLNFEEQFNIYSGRLVGSNRDALEAQVFSFEDIDSLQSSKMRFASTSTIGDYAVGQDLRIYGADDVGVDIDFDTSGITTTVVQQGFNQAGDDNSKTLVSYRFALFDTDSGQVSNSSAPQTTLVKPYDVNSSFPAAFNSSVFVRISIDAASGPDNIGMLVYRKIDGTDSDHRLIAVLGTKEVKEGIWKDYMSFDYVSWSGKNATYNYYTSIPHFPLTLSSDSAPTRGWVDVTIESIIDDNNLGGFDIILKNTVNVNPNTWGGQPTVYHNDTKLIQTAVDDNSAAGKKSVTLNPRPYNVTEIIIPNGFGITGTRSVSKIKKLPWSGGKEDFRRNGIIRSLDQTAASQISLVGFDIDGNSSYQFLFSDSTNVNLSLNYALNFGTGASSILLDGMRVTYVAGGGLWAPEAIDLSLRSGEFINSGVSDRHCYSPISSPGSKGTIIIGNKIKNYTEYVDVATTTQGVVTNNIVENCGSGIYVYGSTFFLSSSNVLMGPAGEFLPSPDILNSAYDSINLNLTASGNSTYNSDSMVYQENGAGFDLTANSIVSPPPELIYRAFYIQKDEKGVEEVYGTGTTAGNFIPGIRYMITKLEGTNQVQWNTAAGTATVGGQDVIYEEGDSFIAAAAGAGTGTATSGGVDGIVFSDVSGTFRQLGEFKFQILAPVVQTILNAEEPYSYSTLKAANLSETSEHVGIAWTASHRNYVKAGDLDEGGWLQDANPANTATFVVAVSNQKYLSVGMTVLIDGRTDWRNRPQAAASQYSGKIISISGETVSIQFKGTGIGTPIGGDPTTNLISGTGGTLNIVDEFILAKGRII